MDCEIFFRFLFGRNVTPCGCSLSATGIFSNLVDFGLPGTRILARSMEWIAHARTPCLVASIRPTSQRVRTRRSEMPSSFAACATVNMLSASLFRGRIVVTINYQSIPVSARLQVAPCFSRRDRLYPRHGQKTSCRCPSPRLLVRRGRRVGGGGVLGRDARKRAGTVAASVGGRSPHAARPPTAVVAIVVRDSSPDPRRTRLAAGVVSAGCQRRAIGTNGTNCSHRGMPVFSLPEQVSQVASP